MEDRSLEGGGRIVLSWWHIAVLKEEVAYFLVGIPAMQLGYSFALNSIEA